MAYGWRVKYPARFTEALVRGLWDAGEETFKLSQQRVPVDKGTLRKSGVLVKLPQGFRIIYRTSYAARQEFGIKPGTFEHVRRHSVRTHRRRATGKVRKTITVKQHQRGPYTRRYPKGVPGKLYLSSSWGEVRPRLVKLIVNLERKYG